MSSSGKIEYRQSNRPWVVLAGCCIMCAIGFPVPVTCWSVCMTPIINDIGINYTQASMYMMAATLVCMVSMIIAPKLIKIGAGKMVALCGIIAAAGFLLIALAPSAQTVVAGGALAGLAYPLASLYTAPVLVKNWFSKKQGLFTAIAMAFIGVGGVIFSPLTTALIDSFSWRTAMIILAVVEAVLLAVVGLTMLRTSPIPLGIRPYGATEAEVEAITASDAMVIDKDKVPGLTHGQSFKSSSGWFILVVLLGLGAMATVVTNANPMVQKYGYAAGAAAIALSCVSLGNITGKLIMGWASDKRGAQFGCLVAAVMTVVGCVGYLLSFSVFHNDVLLYVSAFICGNGCCMATMMPPLVTMDAFGPKDYDRLYGIYSAIRGLMAAVMTLAVGRMVDASGSYESTLIFWIVACVILVPFAYAGIRAGQKRWKDARATKILNGEI